MAEPREAFDRRCLPLELSRIEIRAAEGGKPARLTGYAVLWGAESQDLAAGFIERFDKGAFDDVLGTDIVCAPDHDLNRIVARTAAGNLSVVADERGLRYEAELPDTTVARDLAENVRVGNLRGSSFAFRVAPQGDRMERRSDGKLVRTVTKVAALRDVGPVWNPAYKATNGELAVRSLETFLAHEKGGVEKRDLELDPMIVPPELADCVEACTDCELACRVCVEGCSRDQPPASPYTTPALYGAMNAAADAGWACRMATGAMIRGSAPDAPGVVAACAAAADACDACVEECSKYTLDCCARCAEACRIAAEACRAVVRAGVAQGADEPAAVPARSLPIAPDVARRLELATRRLDLVDL